MRTILGCFGWIARPFLRAIIFLPLFIPAMSHAQWSCPTWPSISSVTPSTWVAGQTYNKVVITGTGFKGPTESCNEFFFRVTLTNGGNVTLSDVSTVSDTKMTATVTVPSSDTAQTACVTVEYQWWDVIRKTASGNSGACPPPYSNGNGTVVPFAVPILCSVPSVNSITPDGWWATGQPQDITIAGTCFLTSSYPGGPTKVKVTDAAAVVKLSNINIVSSTQITASVKVFKNAPADPAETATLTVTNPTSGGTPQTATANPAPVVLPVPVVIWKKKTISGDKPQIENPAIIVGQPVELTTIPASLPGGFTISNSTWVVPGNDIKSCTGDDSGITVDDNVDLQDTNTTFYWLYPDTGLNVTYNYCAMDPYGNPICTSPQAKATFKATRPDIGLTVTNPYNQGKVNELPVFQGVVNGKPVCNKKQKMAHMFYGNLHYNSGCTSPYAGPPGIVLTPAGGDGGTYKFIQVIPTDTLTWAGMKPFQCGPYLNVLDGGFDFPGVEPIPPAAPKMAYDGPGQSLPNIYSSGTRDFHALMYLLWQPPQLSGTGTTSIPVPIGHQEWQFGATAAQNVPIGNGKWQQPVTNAAGKVGDLVPSTDTDNAKYGYPIWVQLSNIQNCDPINQTQEIEE